MNVGKNIKILKQDICYRYEYLLFKPDFKNFLFITIYSFLCFLSSIYMKGIEGKVLHLLVYYPNACNSQPWASLKPRARTHIREATSMARDQRLEPSSMACKHDYVEIGSETRRPGLAQISDVGYRHPKLWLNHLGHNIYSLTIFLLFYYLYNFIQIKRRSQLQNR